MIQLRDEEEAHPEGKKRQKSDEDGSVVQPVAEDEEELQRGHFGELVHELYNWRISAKKKGRQWSSVRIMEMRQKKILAKGRESVSAYKVSEAI